MTDTPNLTIDPPSDLASRRSGLSDAKRGLLARWMKGQAQPQPEAAALVRRPRLPDQPEPAPLSFAQQRIWFIDQLEPGSPVYNMSAGFRLEGPLDRGALERSLSEIVRRHEVLRTTFAVPPGTQGTPLQVIRPAQPVEIPFVDLSGMPEAERQAAVRELAREEGRRPFDLARGPLLRLGLVRLNAREHVLLFAISHSISDGWSIGLFLQELAALYRAERAGRPSPLPELTVQYADFAIWQRQHLQGERLATQVEYWKQQLAGAPPLLELPADRPRPPLQSFRGAMLPLAVPAEELARFKALCQAQGVTLYMGLLAAWQALLHRYSGQREIVVGSPVANRRRVELEKLIGFFANTLVLRTDLGGDPSFNELLARVQKVARGAYAHQDVPFERLVEELHPERHLSYTPLFQVMLVLQNAPMPDLALAELTLSILDLDPGIAKFDLLLNVAEAEDGGLTGVLEYSTDLFDEDRMARLLQHLRVLLAEAAADPERPLSALPLLTAEERDRLLCEWNDNAVAHPRVSVHEPVEEQAERTPDAVAALWSGEGAEDGLTLTYRELSHRANQLAHHLRSMGVGPDERVSICLERSLDLLVSVLGVLKAGAAYVPIDPGYPADRVSYMLADSRSRVLVTTAGVAAGLPEHGVRPVLLDMDREVIAARSTQNPPRETTPDHLAYVIYTSGSTGRPKGVAMPQGVLANLLMWQRRASAAGVGSRTLQFASLSFDVSFQEIFSTWWTGGTVVGIPQETRRDALALCRVLHDQGVERLFLPFVALQQIAEAIEHGAPLPEKLAEIVTAGEQLQITRQIASWMERTGAVLENQYGPSEGHVVTVHRLSGRPAEWPALPPIGQPLPNVRTYLLDRHFEPVPQGIPGHLCFGGAQVVRGYLDRPELTAEKFIPDPFSAEPGARLYATGDQARYLADGAIQFLGRIDHQVKIRGFRVEPGEVETALAKHPQVREAAVVVRGDGKDKRLVGYYVADAALSSATLRAFLKEQLPEYMVPSLLVRLDALPLTPSGKVHREALPAPDDSNEPRRAAVAPRNAVEETVAGIWMEVLNLPRVDVHDDFFEQGGHSLTATRLIYGLRKAFGVDLPLRTLFAGPTVTALAEAIGELKKGPAASALPVITREELAAEAILDPAIQGPFTPLPLAGEGSGVRALLLTGATGFLGSFLLRELLRQFPTAQVHALVRGANEAAARRKLVASLEKFNLWDDSLTGRIRIVNGDLGRPLLGLSRPEFDRLAQEIDAIYHNGAFVNLFYAYSTLKPANVLGTQEVLRLAAVGRVKPVHYVSTTGVFFSAGGPPLDSVDEGTPLTAVSGLMGGYAQSKWVAEQLVHLAGERGLPVTVYRPGRIGGHSRTGLGNPDDLVFRILRGSMQLGAAPLLDMEVEMSPVDYVSGALVHLSRQPESAGKTFHLVNPRVAAWNELLDWIDVQGRPLRRLAWTEWQNELRHAAERSADNVLYPLLPVLTAGESAEDDAHAPRIECARTQAALAGSGIDCPRLDAGLLSLYLDRLQASTPELAVSR